VLRNASAIPTDAVHTGTIDNQNARRASRPGVARVVDAAFDSTFEERSVAKAVATARSIEAGY
jgi:hypothetical protein